MNDQRQTERHAGNAGTEPSLQKSASQDQTGKAQEPNFKFVQVQTPPEDSYADGPAAMSVGRNVLKLDLYRAAGVDPQDKKEIRILSHRIVLPLTAIPELMHLLQSYNNAVQKAAQAQAEQSDAILDFNMDESV